MNWEINFTCINFSLLHFPRLQCLQSFTFSKTTMSSIFYNFKDFNVFCLLYFQRLQCFQSFTLSKCLQSFTLSESSVSSALCFIRLQCLLFDAFKTSISFTFMLYRTSMSSILRFKGLQGPLFGVIGLQCPFVFLVSLLLFSLAPDFE